MGSAMAIECPVLSGRAQFSMTRGEPGAEEHGGRDHSTEALPKPRPVGRRDGLPEVANGPALVSLGLAGYPEAVTRQRL